MAVALGWGAGWEDAQGQVITRAARVRKDMKIRLEAWPEGLSRAWKKCWPAAEDELEGLAEQRVRIVKGLAESGHGEQAHAAAEVLVDWPRYAAFSHLGRRLRGEWRQSAIAEAERGFQFLSLRNQERLAVEMMGIAVEEGSGAVREMLGRCFDREERIIALGRAAHFAAGVNREVFEECIAELTDPGANRNALEKRHTAVALQEAAEGARLKGDSRGSGWAGICEAAAAILEQCPLNSAEVLARLAGTYFAGREEEKGAAMLGLAKTHWQRLGRGTPEGMAAMEAITEAAVKSAEDRLGEDWDRNAAEAAAQGEEDWRWELWVKAGRICRVNGNLEGAIAAWGEAMKRANGNANPGVRTACETMIALEAHEAGIRWEEVAERKTGRTISGGIKREVKNGQ